MRIRHFASGAPCSTCKSWQISNKRAIISDRVSAIIASGQYGPAAGSNPNPTGDPQSSLVQLGDDGKLFMVYQTKTVLAALVEGAAFLNIVAFLLGGRPISLGLGLLLALAIVALFPRTSQVVEWTASQRRLMAEEKLLAR